MEQWTILVKVTDLWLFMVNLAGYRGLLFKQVLPGLEPLFDTMRQISKRRGKTFSQVM